MPAPVICENSFSALKEEVLYDFPLNLGLMILLRALCAVFVFQL